MAALPYMPLYVADYLADAAHLSTLGHGAYLLLIMTYWQRGEALPDDERKLMRIARVTPDEWEDVREDMAEFFDISGGLWRHKRIDAELAKVAQKSESARAARMSREPQGNVQRTSNGRATDVKRTSNHTDTDTDIKPPSPIGDAPPKPRATGSRLPEDWQPDDSLLTWAAAKHPEIDVRRETEKFRNHFHAKTGKDATKLDWGKTWQNWIMNSEKFNGGKSSDQRTWGQKLADAALADDSAP